MICCDVPSTVAESHSPDAIRPLRKITKYLHRIGHKRRMISILTIGQQRRIANGFADGFAAPVVALALFGLLIIRGVWILPNGYDGSAGLNVILLLLLGFWSMGTALRCQKPGSRLASVVVALCLYIALCFFASLSSASNAIGGGEYIDPWLAWIDKLLFPFYDWKAVALELPNYPWIYWILNICYNSFGWQPFLYIAVAAKVGNTRDMGAFVTAWGLGLLVCVLPFHWLPARSPYPYFGIAQTEMPNHLTALPWEFLVAFEGIREGRILAISVDCVTGMITMPSFHAGGAVILAWAFWRFQFLRWPFLLLNILVALSAVPIGSHYVIDIVAGSAVGAFAVAGAMLLNFEARQVVPDAQRAGKLSRTAGEQLHLTV